MQKINNGTIIAKLWQNTTMRYLLILASLLPLKQLKAQIQLVEIGSSSCLTDSTKQFYFENDTIRVVYNFWNNFGQINCVITNKLAQPIFINWNSSAAVFNDVTKDYSNEPLTINANSDLDLNGLPPLLTNRDGTISTKGTISNPASSNIIAPKAKYKFQGKQIKAKNTFYKLSDTCKSRKQEFKNSEIKMAIQNFDPTNTPLQFRNYITFNIAKIDGPTYTIDHGFYISTIREFARKKDFRSYSININSNNPPQPVYPFKAANSFFVEPI